MVDNPWISRALSRQPEHTHSPTLSLLAGLDIVVRKPITVRTSISYQVVFSDDLRALYGSNVQRMGVLVGLGLAIW